MSNLASRYESVEGLNLMRIYVLFLVRYSILREYPLKVGVDCDEVPPVPIPNTVVKLIYVENTWRVTAREDR